MAITLTKSTRRDTAQGTIGGCRPQELDQQSGAGAVKGATNLTLRRQVQ